jgi:hypothetical protein
MGSFLLLRQEPVGFAQRQHGNDDHPGDDIP